jgi:hypothetical protein
LYPDDIDAVFYPGKYMAMSAQPPLFVAFAGPSLLASGEIGAVARAVHAHAAGRTTAPILIFDAASSTLVDLDLRGDADEAAARAESRLAPPAEGARGRGRPKLGVEAHEVTLLPRHWNWLRAQPGGASIALRKLVEAAARDPKERRRRAQESAYRFMSAIAGNRPGFEEAARVLFAGDQPAFANLVALWPSDIRAHLAAVAAPAFSDKGDAR